MRMTGLLWAIAAAVAWGMVYALNQKILTKVSPAGLIFIDAILSLIVLTPFFFYDASAFRGIFSGGISNLFLIVISLLLVITANFFIYSAIQSVGASVASTFEIAYPFFVMLFAYFLFGQEITMPVIVGALFIFAGALTIIKFG